MPVQVDVLEVDILGTVPVVECRMFDGRQTCAPVLLYLAGVNDGRPTDYADCASYRAGQCGRGGHNVTCAFLEPDTAPVWAKAATWRLLLLPDGTTAATLASTAPDIARDLGAKIFGAEVVVP